MNDTENEQQNRGENEEDEEGTNNTSLNSNGSANHCRLRRRDTPHHLKGARIQSPGTNKAQQLDPSEMREILDKYKPAAAVAPVPAARTLATTPTSSVAAQQQHPQQQQQQLQPSATQYMPADISRYDPIRKHVQLVVGLSVGASGGLGIRIAGGKGSANPYRDDDDGIFITRILVDSPARQTGLKVGDKLMKVNHLALSELTHQQAADALKDAVKGGAGAQLSLSVLQEVDYNKVCAHLFYG
jgi:C-terminal processing protease CtpA/Prc